MSATLSARNIHLSRGDRTILAAIDLTVAPGDRIGVIAPNGTGKSTLLRVLAGQQAPDSGAVTALPAAATVGYLPQEPDRRPGETARAHLARRTGVDGATVELDAAAQALADGAPGADDRYAVALDRWLALGGADLDARIGPLWAELGLPDALLDRDMTALSGGQAARVSLAAILLSSFDVFLLDEPTNDLDFDALERLEGFIERLPGGVVIVSHDRAFLARTIATVFEIDEHAHTGRRFEGGWEAFLDERATARRHAEEDYAVYTDRRRELEGRIQTQRQWAVQGVASAKRRKSDPDKFVTHFRTQTSENLAAKVRISEKALDRLEAVDKPWEGWELRMTFAEAPRSGNVVARLSGAVVERGEFRMGPVDLEVGWAERIAIVGPNGSGKSTLLAALFGQVDLAAGTSWVGPGVVVGELDQGRAHLSGERSLLDAFCAATAIEAPQEARSLLAKFGLSAEHVARSADSLSPGERTRATLAQFMARGVNCLVLDEPTNHLDLPAIEQLEQALDTFGGTVLLVTHDRQLLDAVRTDRTVTLPWDP